MSKKFDDPNTCLFNEDTDQHDIQLPTKWTICGACNGEGKSSAYLGSFTASEFHEAFDDEEADAYFSGAYDRACEECDGDGKVKIVDVDKLDEDQARSWDAQERARHEVDWAEAAERRYFARCSGDWG
jgi:RecJ-like exonuclease